MEAAVQRAGAGRVPQGRHSSSAWWAFVGVLILRAAQGDVVKAMFMEPGAIPELARVLVMKLLGALMIATIVLVAADLVWSRVYLAARAPNDAPGGEGRA